MNYYPRHLGDYAKDTGHLSMLEHGAYTLLLDRYYSTDAAIPADQTYRLTRARSREERAAVDSVLAEFFTLNGDWWTNSRADKEIEKALVKISSAQINGKLGGRPKKKPDATDEKPSGFPPGSEDGTQTKALQSPITNNQEPNNPPPASPSVPPSDAGSEKPPRPSKRCPDEFAPSQQLIDAMLLEAPDIDVERELAKFRDHTFRVGRTDWAATFRNWLRESVDRSKPSGGSFLDAKKAEGAKWFKDTSFDLSSTANRDSFDAQLAIR